MNASPAWYAIWTRSRHEQVVRDQIVTKGYEAFLPTVGKWSRWKDRKKKVDWPLFPGYCFARFDPNDRLPILKCTGVVSIVSFDSELAPIPEPEIDGIRRLVQSDLQYDPCPFIREGEMVEVTGGPLKGVFGRLVRKGAHARLILTVDLIGQAVSVEGGCGGREKHENRHHRSFAGVRPRTNGGDDRHCLPPTRQARGRLRARRDRDGEL